MTKTTAGDAATARTHLEGSLRRMNTDAIDLWQIHALKNPEDADNRLALIQRSTGGGNVWLPISSGTTDTLTSVAFKGTAVVAVGQSGTIRRSGNSGGSFTSVSAGTTADLVAVSASSAWNGAAGSTGADVTFVAASSTSLLISADSGTSWTARASGPGTTGLAMSSPTALYVIGTSGEGREEISVCLWPINATVKANICAKSRIAPELVEFWFDQSFPDNSFTPVALAA